MKRLGLVLSLFILATVGGTGCACGVNSEEAAQVAYLGLDQAMARAMRLGFDGFNAATSANIPAQSDDGDESGEMKIDGEVDQGASANKGMRLDMELTEYSDGEVEADFDDDGEADGTYQVTYDTTEGDGDPLFVEMKLRDIPNGTFTGTITGTVIMRGDIEGEAEFNLTLAGAIEEDPDNAGDTQREEGSTRVEGKVTSGSGEYDVDVEI
jgi:hypothetical protein